MHRLNRRNEYQYLMIYIVRKWLTYTFFQPINTFMRLREIFFWHQASTSMTVKLFSTACFRLWLHILFTSVTQEFLLIDQNSTVIRKIAWGSLNVGILSKNLKTTAFEALVIVKQLRIPIFFMKLLCTDLWLNELIGIISKLNSSNLTDNDIKNTFYH